MDRGKTQPISSTHTRGCEMQDLSRLGCSWWPSQGISGCSNSYLTCGEPTLAHIPVS